MLQVIEAMPWSSPETRNQNQWLCWGNTLPNGLSTSPAWNLTLWPYGRRHWPEVGGGPAISARPWAEASTGIAIPVQRKTDTFRAHTRTWRERERDRETYIYICIYIYTYTYTYIHACIHTYIHKYIHTYMHACMHAYITYITYIYI